MLLEHILDFVYPPVCSVCSTRLTQKDAVAGLDAKQLCLSCSISSSPLLLGYSFSELNTDNACKCCGEPEPVSGPLPGVCLYCYLWPLPAREIRSLWQYETQVEEVIKAFKYRSRTQLAKLIGTAMVNGICGGKLFSQGDWDLVIALPSTPAATRERGFAHTTFIAREVASLLQIPCKAGALEMSADRTQQTAVPFAERFGNMRGAFRVRSGRRSCDLRGKSALLIDDVLTTGASSMHATFALLDAGCKVVDIYTVCRSVNFYKRRLSLVRSLTESPRARKQ